MTVLLVGYLGCSIIYSAYDPKMISNVGLFMLYVILDKIILNLLVVTKSLLLDVKLMLRKANYKKAKKNYHRRLKLRAREYKIRRF